MKKSLKIVDVQHDFIEGASLAVDVVRNAMDKVVKHIIKHHKEYDVVFPYSRKER